MIKRARAAALMATLFHSIAYGQNSAASFSQQSFQTTLPLLSERHHCGDVKVTILNETLEKIERESFVAALKKCSSIDEDIIGQMPWFKPERSPFRLSYNPVYLHININIPVELERSREHQLQMNMRERYAHEALAPAPIGGAINYRIEKTWAADELKEESFNTYFDSFFNINDFVLESKLNYYDQEQNGTGWFRGDTRLIKDIQKYDLRVQAGDIYPQNFGFMSGSSIGGVQVATDFSLDPYSIPFPQGQGSFVLQSRAQVKTWVNGVLIKNEFLPAGNYDLRDIPLINGLNTVVVETIDDLGVRKVYQFNLATSVELLAKGRWKYSISSGRPFSDQLFKRTYQNSTLHSAFAQYGLSDTFTLGGYAQNQNDYTLGGFELGKATEVGNFFIGGANSFQESRAGQAAQVAWQLQNLGSKLFSSYTFNLRHQRFTDDFVTSEHGFVTNLKSRWQANFTLPIQEVLTASLGAQWAESHLNNAANRWGYDATLNLRLMHNLSLSMFASRIRDEQSHWNDVAYAFLTWSFDGSSHLVNAFYDFENQSTRLSAIRDNSNQLYSPRVTSSIENGKTSSNAEVDTFVPMPFADIGGRIQARKLDQPDGTYMKATARVASAFVFAYDGQFAIGISRPVPNSFVLFKPSKNLADQDLSLRSVSPYHESSSGLFGELSYTNLLPYQYREIQLDPSQLDAGTTLEQERFVIYPHYRSAHLLPVTDKGSLILKGRLLKNDKTPMSLKVGQVSDQLFFTTRDGDFFIEGLAPGVHIIKINDTFQGVRVQINDNERGIKDLGNLVYPKGEE